ncbi:hypothetical protein OG883_03780 [Streptomyces sp. NBC_01142]|uniref:hypothetical protein n=1 Tax=Streptomyces sp. NBC_01142 TaxID=2975865 RepID=UPI00224E9D3C|nr:hypothetical protein [Streptomyces sp. NBC_01142]MCX4819037.1 hypothetical protein [Streptomyces sp. NBC_01142]
MLVLPGFLCNQENPTLVHLMKASAPCTCRITRIPLESTISPRVSSPVTVKSRPSTFSVPRLTEGTELVGEFEGSGYREPPQLVRRFDGQVVRLPELLYLLARLTQIQQQSNAIPQSAQQYLSWLSDALSRETGREFEPSHIVFLIDKKLAPLGVTTYSDGSPPEITKANPFLALRFRKAVFSESASWSISGLFTWLFRPVVMLLAVGAFVFCESLLFSSRSMASALQQALVTPASILLVVLLTLVSSAFHEIGHAAACRSSGARPGAMGCGIYLVWPAFYTDVTDSYRLGRAGRLRVDLGGVYFNALFIVGLSFAYLATGWYVLLVAILAINLEIVQQLIPSLRFDGYYIISDLVGIPDLFKYIGPILKRALLRRPADESLLALKRWPQVVVTVWVLCVVPALAIQLGILIVRVPDLVRTGWHTVGALAGSATTSGNPVLGVLSAGVQILLLLLPVAGAVIIVLQLVRGAVRFVRKRLGVTSGKHGRRPPYLLWGVVIILALALAGLTWGITRSAHQPAYPVGGPPMPSTAESSSPSDTSAPTSEPDRPAAVVPVHRPTPAPTVAQSPPPATDGSRPVARQGTGHDAPTGAPGTSLPPSPATSAPEDSGTPQPEPSKSPPCALRLNNLPVLEVISVSCD